jgi:hypothetical protein
MASREIQGIMRSPDERRTILPHPGRERYRRNERRPGKQRLLAFGPGGFHLAQDTVQVIERSRAVSARVSEPGDGQATSVQEASQLHRSYQPAPI